MTTIDDADLFGEAFGGFRTLGEGRRPRHGLLTALVLVAGLALVAVAFVWARDARAADAPAHVEPLTLLAAFGDAQTAVDSIPADAARALLVEPSSTRFLVETASGKHYAAVSRTGELCVVTLPSGDVPEAGCVASVADARIASGDVWLAADADRAPTDEGWRSAGPNVWVRG
ncbi:hypothetical protein [Cellulomonas fimi]|uniref:Uncharacterized protein n=1 Tax=Cellulomonas fimi (strain ATCC 484 / DSM 20113 / JCM 1341 / CCUG 24087 / LMG 16345 / NBRC 15513 / NCIMB 8980 / NCTC 7547 / NRS-133) TaxID=590998 RepID=F4H8B9_CELFA|nr:hypothetical protein [Cellulomonas fimi]AEE44676.1 protein of unknown function DUF214 [Cellulomonas fimi ATCC 484]NNH07488.1 hypothetical protein [Cellulomonas fimi]VEH26977.1 Uncharacterised protein [Cellulomonas fimi]